MQDKQLGQLLIEMGYLTEEQLGVALSVQRVHSGVLGEILTSLAFVSSAETASAVAKQAGRPFTDISGIRPDSTLLRMFDTETLKSSPSYPLTEAETQSA
ncbi:MAG: hypothetical protein LRY51_13885 [Geovibrio sp.]|nr:hypothetical protein [Geovibrio sp.]